MNNNNGVGRVASDLPGSAKYCQCPIKGTIMNKI